MKVETPSLLKKIMAALSSKTNELRIRIMIFFLLHKNIDKTTLTHTLSNKLHALVSHPHNHHLNKKNDDVLHDNYDQEKEKQEENEVSSLLVYYKGSDGGGAHVESAFVGEDVKVVEEGEGEGEESLTHALFKESEAAMEEEEEEEIGGVGGGGVVVDAMEMVEEDIDQAADLFIKRFKRQIQLQKLEGNHPQLLQI